MVSVTMLLFFRSPVKLIQTALVGFFFSIFFGGTRTWSFTVYNFADIILSSQCFSTVKSFMPNNNSEVDIIINFIDLVEKNNIYKVTCILSLG